jgi:SAM-dependent methyltransferase
MSREYWNSRYEDEGRVWGDIPSKTAERAREVFRQNGVRTILLPGSGYGRNSKLFSGSRFEVTGVEVSDIACRLAHEYDPATVFFEASVLDMSFLVGTFNAVYCFNVLHLFREADRKHFLEQCAGKLDPGGLAFFAVFSEQAQTFGKGAQIEPNTFESKPGRPVHYFSDPDLRAHFSDFDVLESGLMEDEENHGEGPHTHVLRYILARKSA